MAIVEGSIAEKQGIVFPDAIVEFGLLLPARSATQLVELSKRRRQTVAQLLRSLIDRALNDPENATAG